MANLSQLQMPSIDTGQLSGKDGKKIKSYLFQIQEMLRYALNDIDEDNLSEELRSKIESGGLSSEISQALDAITLRVTGLDDAQAELKLTAEGLTSQVEAQGGRISTLEQTATSITARVETAEGDITTLTATANGLTTRVESAEGDVTTIKQWADSLTLSVANGDSSSTIRLMAGSTEISSGSIGFTGVVTFSDLSTWNQDKTIINGGNITTGQIHNKARTTTYDLDNAWIRMGKDSGTRVDIDTGRIRWYWENNLTGVLSSRYGKSYIGDNSRYTFLGWFSTGDPSFDYSTGGATSEFVGIAIDQVDKVIHCNASKFEIPGRIECGSLSVNGREI